VTIDFPGSSFSVSTGFNSRGDIVGMMSLPGDPKGTRHGYLLRDGVFSAFDPPTSIFTNGLGINDRGDIVGRFCRMNCGVVTSDMHGFLLRDGGFTRLDVPGALATHAWKIGPDGEILGAYQAADGSTHVFLLEGDEYTTIDLPGQTAILLENGGLNTRGDIVGTYCDEARCDVGAKGNHGFMLADDAFVTIDFPGAISTATFGVNARRDVVGFYVDANGTPHGFVLAGSGANSADGERGQRGGDR
jgi:hypothetical protein